MSEKYEHLRSKYIRIPCSNLSMIDTRTENYPSLSEYFTQLRDNLKCKCKTHTDQFHIKKYITFLRKRLLSQTMNLTCSVKLDCFYHSILLIFIDKKPLYHLQTIFNFTLWWWAVWGWVVEMRPWTPLHPKSILDLVLSTFNDIIFNTKKGGNYVILP